MTVRRIHWFWSTALATVVFGVVAYMLNTWTVNSYARLALRLGRATHCNYFQSGGVAMFKGADGRWSVFSESPWAPLANWVYFSAAPWTGLLVGFAGALGVYAWLSRARRPDGHTHCGECGYILKGLAEPRCPECGHAI
jgi:hypothetical protein